MGTVAEDAAAIARTLIADGESYYVEFKSAWEYGVEGRVPRDPREVAGDIGKTIVAFANADGGDLLVGVEDNGNIHHERFYRALEQVGVDASGKPTLTRDGLMQVARTNDRELIAALINQWKQAGILTPAGPKQFELGPSFLAYVDQRE